MTDDVQFLESPQVAKLFDLALQLATDLHVTTARAHALEALLVRHGVLSDGELDQFTPTESEQHRLDGVRDQFTARLLRVITEAGPADHPLREQWEAQLAAGARR